MLWLVSVNKLHPLHIAHIAKAQRANSEIKASPNIAPNRMELTSSIEKLHILRIILPTHTSQV